MKFIIVSPRQRSGGPIVLHLLCKLLNEMGHDARIFYFYGENEKIKYNDKVFWNNYKTFFIKDFIKDVLTRIPVLRNYMKRFAGYYYKPIDGTKRQITPHFNKDKTIVIYPEIVYGNFLKAKNVVRYLLYYNRYKNEAEAYDKNDMFVCYREIFNDYDLNPECKKMTLLNFDSKLYRQTNFGEREGTCYIVRKGRNRPDLPEEFDGIVVDTLDEAAKVKVFNQCKYCISYDMQTFYSTVAAICGCIVIQKTEEGKTRSDYLSDSDVKYGVAYGDSEEELKYANETRHLIIEQIQREQETNIVEVKRFVQYCQDYFGSRS